MILGIRAWMYDCLGQRFGCAPTSAARRVVPTEYPVFDASASLLQAEGPVMCYFNQHFKIDPTTFGVWTSALRALNATSTVSLPSLCVMLDHILHQNEAFAKSQTAHHGQYAHVRLRDHL
jgi:hypothetical protein